MDKPLLAFILILGMMGIFFGGHEIGFLNGQEYQKGVNAKKLENCNRILVGGIYE